MTIMAALIVSLVITYWFVKSRKKTSSRAQRTKTEIRRYSDRKSTFHAVSIKPGGCGCEAVNAMGSERYLTSGAVPTLPVPNCTLLTCTCRYVHHDDRRSRQGNRRAAFSMQTDMYGVSGEKERRGRRGRRYTDAEEPLGDLGESQWNT